MGLSRFGRSFARCAIVERFAGTWLQQCILLDSPDTPAQAVVYKFSMP